MIVVTDQILTDVIKNMFNVKCIFGHEDRVAKSFYNRESNTIVTDFAILFRELIRKNNEIEVGHLHGKQGFDVYKDRENSNGLVWKYIPAIYEYSLKFFLSDRFKMNDVIRAYFFWRFSPNITVNIAEIFKNIEFPEDLPLTFNISIRNDSSDFPIDETDYYSGSDNIIFKLNCKLSVESILVSPTIEPLINHVNLKSTVYDREGNIEDSFENIIE